VLSLNPGDSMSRGTHGWFLLNRRRFEEALQEVRKALELDPLMPLYYAWSVGLHWSAGKPDEALREFAKAMEIDPNPGLACFHASVAYFLKGMWDKAIESLEKGKTLFAPPGWAEGMIGLIGLKRGMRDQAKKILDGLTEQKKTVPNTSSVSLAWLAGELGELDLAFSFLDRGYEEHDTLMAFVHIYAPVFSPPVAADPRFKDVLSRMKLAA
jgi:adenylate cyclase